MRGEGFTAKEQVCIRLVKKQQAFIWGNARCRRVFLPGGLCQLYKTAGPFRFAFKMQGRDKKRFEGSQIGQALVLLEAADLTFAVANALEFWPEFMSLARNGKYFGELCATMQALVEPAN